MSGDAWLEVIPENAPQLAEQLHDMLIDGMRKVAADHDWSPALIAKAQQKILEYVCAKSPEDLVATFHRLASIEA